jgi:hypothetical protein
MFDIETGYVPAPTGEQEELYRTSIQWSRRHIGLKVFFTLAALGAEGLRRTIEHQAAMGDALRAKLADAGWVVVNASVLPLVCFTHPRIRSGARSAADVVERVCSTGRAWISEVRLTGIAPAVRAHHEPSHDGSRPRRPYRRARARYRLDQHRADWPSHRAFARRGSSPRGGLEVSQLTNPLADPVI